MRNQGFAIRVVDAPLYNGAVVDRTTPIRRAALSADTTAEAQQLQIRLWRRLSDVEAKQGHAAAAAEALDHAAALRSNDAELQAAAAHAQSAANRPREALAAIQRALNSSRQLW